MGFRVYLLVEYPGELKVNLWEYIGIIKPQKVKGYLLYRMYAG